MCKKTLQLIPAQNSRGIFGVNYDTVKSVDVFGHSDNAFDLTYYGQWKVINSQDIMWFLRCGDLICEVMLRNNGSKWIITSGRRPNYGHFNLWKDTEIGKRIESTIPTSFDLSAGLQCTGSSFRIRESDNFDNSPVYFAAEDIWSNPNVIVLPNMARRIIESNPRISKGQLKHHTRRSYGFYCKRKHIKHTLDDLFRMTKLAVAFLDDNEISIDLNQRTLAIKEFKDVEVYRDSSGAIRGFCDQFDINLNFSGSYHTQSIANLLNI